MSVKILWFCRNKYLGRVEINRINVCSCERCTGNVRLLCPCYFRRNTVLLKSKLAEKMLIKCLASGIWAYRSIGFCTMACFKWQTGQSWLLRYVCWGHQQMWSYRVRLKPVEVRFRTLEFRCDHWVTWTLWIRSWKCDWLSLEWC